LTRAGAAESLWKRREVSLLIAWIVLVAAIAVKRPDFLSGQNLADILLNASAPAIAACGMTALIVAAQIDISIGAILSFCAVVVAIAAKNGAPVPGLIAAGVAVGSLLGAMNGLLVAGLRIPSIVATLATMGAIRGLLVLIGKGQQIDLPDPVYNLANARFLGLTTPVWVAAAVTLGASLHLGLSRSGRRYYAVGSNSRAAELTGIAVNWVTFRSFVLLGGLVGLAACLTAARNHSIEATPTRGFELEVITAVVVGGTDIFGGRGTVLGSVMAAILLVTIGTALTFAGSFTALRSEIQPAVQGLLILVAVLYNSLSRKAADTDR
jgi:ribose/xylose/arabinose/galactoside ABC-type transport system permease subunit